MFKVVSIKYKQQFDSNVLITLKILRSTSSQFSGKSTASVSKSLLNHLLHRTRKNVDNAVEKATYIGLKNRRINILF